MEPLVADAWVDGTVGKSVLGFLRSPLCTGTSPPRRTTAWDREDESSLTHDTPIAGWCGLGRDRVPWTFGVPSISGGWRDWPAVDRPHDPASEVP